jgi:hypothetical protein
MQTLTGQKIDTESNYCIGVFKNNSLFLNPITNFMQFRHDFSNIEGNTETKKKLKEKNTKRNITLTNDFRENDKFSDLAFFQKDSIHSGQCYEKLYFEETSEAKNFNFLSPSEYYQLMFGNMNREILIDGIKNKNEESFSQICKKTVNEKIIYIMKKLSILTFDTLKMILKELGDSNIPDMELLEQTLNYARILKNGNLVYKSEIKYPESLKNEMSMKRDYLINLLQNQQDGITFSDIKFLEKKEIDEILSEIGYTKGGKIYIKENNIENSEFKKIFKKYYDQDLEYWNNSGNRKTTTVPQSQTMRSQTETIEALINRIFMRADIVQFQSLYDQIRSELTGDNDKLINESISKYCHIINGVCYIKDVKDNDVNKVRNKLFELFRKKKSIKKAEIREQIIAAGIEVTDTILNRILKSIANSEKNEWKLKLN